MLEFFNLANLCIIATTEWIFLAGGKFVGCGWSCKVFVEVMMTFSARATVGNYQHIAAQSELNQVYQYCRGRGSLKVFVNIPSGWHEMMATLSTTNHEKWSATLATGATRGEPATLNLNWQIQKPGSFLFLPVQRCEPLDCIFMWASSPASLKGASVSDQIFGGNPRL